LVMSGMVERGVEAIKKGLEHIPMDPRLSALLCYTYAKTGKGTWSKECLDQLLSLAEKRFVDPYFVTWPYAALRDITSACYWLKKAYDEHSEWLPWLGIDPLLDNLRKEPMFNELLIKMNLGK